MKTTKIKTWTIISLFVTFMWVVTLPLELIRMIAFFLAAQSPDWCAFTSIGYWVFGVALLISSLQLLGYCYVNNININPEIEDDENK